jgi:pimeloyl-ACP methyl ester carboxylesterase
MMPFSVLRTWGFGLLSWAILAGGFYFLYEWADGVDPPVVRSQLDDREPARHDTAATNISSDAPVAALDGSEDAQLQVIGRDRQGGWPYLAAAIGLLGFSTFGFIPLTLILGKPGIGEPRSDVQGQTLRINRDDGTQLHVEVLGQKHAPTLVMVHGWSLDRSAWYYAFRRLAESYRLVRWDLPGLGNSRGPNDGDYRIEKMANDLAAVVERAGPGPIIIVGHSIGGMIAQTFCRLYPKLLGSRVGGLVLVHTTYTNPLRTAFLSGLWTALEKPVIVPLNHLTVWLAPIAWLSNWQSYLNGTLHLMTRFASFAGGQTWGQLNHGARLAAMAWPAVVARGNLAMLEFDEQPELPKIGIPVLVIASQFDRMTRPQASERLDQLLPNCRYATVPAGHLGLWEHEAKVFELISEFADQVSAQGEKRLQSTITEKPSTFN